MKTFSVGERVYTQIPAKCKEGYTKFRYVGEIVRAEGEYYCVTFNSETQRLAKSESEVELITPLAVMIEREKIWAQKINKQRVEVIEFIPPFWAKVKYSNGEIEVIHAGRLVNKTH